MTSEDVCYLLDENLPPQVADGLSTIGFAVYAVGRGPAPARRSSDETNVQWCVRRDAILVTEDRGRKNREILELMGRHRVHVLRVPRDVTAKELARALLRNHDRISNELARCRRRSGTLRFRLGRGGGLARL